MKSKKSKFVDGEVKGDLFVFPTWTNNSFVKSQNLVTRIPKDWQIAVMYGAGRSGNSDDQLIDGGTENKEEALLIALLNENRQDHEDNLIKGASGQAVQNMNVAFKLEESMGLI